MGVEDSSGPIRVVQVVSHVFPDQKSYIAWCDAVADSLDRRWVKSPDGTLSSHVLYEAKELTEAPVEGSVFDVGGRLWL